MNITFKLEDFEGPLDLLLFLLEKNKMSIYDIEISSITDQYMEYIDQGQHLPLDQMSEFIVMASTLLYIKSKMLLPRPKKEEDLAEEDPREELIRKLVEYKKIKYVSEELNERQSTSSTYCFRNKEIPIELEAVKPSLEDVLENVTLQHLYELFQSLLKENNLLRAEKERKMDASILRKDTYTIEQKSMYILNILALQNTTSFSALCHVGMPKLELIVTFMSLLELVHKKQITIRQEGPLEDILIEGVTDDEKN